MSESQPHPFVTIRVRPEQLELAELRLWELGASGLEERDETTLVRESASDEVVVIAAFPDEAGAQHALKEIREEYEAEIIYMPGEDWATEWRRGFGAQRIGKRLLLHPSWEAVQSTPRDVVLTIDPENAFGSGDHETTRLVLLMLDQQVAGGERVLRTLRELFQFRRIARSTRPTPKRLSLSHPLVAGAVGLLRPLSDSRRRAVIKGNRRVVRCVPRCGGVGGTGQLAAWERGCGGIGVVVRSGCR